MAKNTQVETAQKSQATKKNNIPTGKVKTLKSAEERRKTREEQFRNFRINALKRRCARMKYTEEQTEEFVKKLIEQMDAPKEYSILIMLSVKDNPMMNEALKKANITYKYHGDTYFSIDGNQEVLAKIREIAPPSAKIYPYAKKMESVLPKQEKEVIKKPTNNTAEKKAAANPKRPMHKTVKSTRYMHRMQVVTRIYERFSSLTSVQKSIRLQLSRCRIKSAQKARKRPLRTLKRLHNLC